LLTALSSDINKSCGETIALPYAHDVNNYDAVPELLRQIVSDLGGLDLVIYAAGVNFPPGPDAYNFDADRQMLEVNLIGAFAWLNPIAAMFQSAKSGQIVGISSVAGDRGRVGNPGYNTSKAALTTYLEALRNRLTRHGVNVITVKPGFVQTDMLKAAQKVMFPISVDKAADDIWRAIRARKQQIYTPWFWSWIMFVIRNTPSVLFRRMSF
jgi:NAD(P)-dependent dehydrogenase (short-subunit alcohol dehydrogenase family)